MKSSRDQSRIVSYAQPAPSFGKRLRRVVLSPVVLIPVAGITVIVLGFLIYYWSIFSRRIDNLLNGEVFTRSAGIYAAPKQLHVGQALSQDQLLEFLKSDGYVEKGQQADKARGRYAVNNGAVEIEPSDNTVVDGQRQFQRVRVQFARTGKAIAGLSELDTNARMDKAWLEPQLISSVTGRDRSKRKVIGFNDLPPQLVKAIVVTEDRSFFEHYGVNVRGILRALVRRYDSDPNSP
ncbi:MAG TPA: transglycosylase domain-containing protein, partial [Pyrinomonadaceae bacterium]|nr:transglycosylase domain-containing protein [Pyrinomonadaceae bacterium]